MAMSDRQPSRIEPTDPMSTLRMMRTHFKTAFVLGAVDGVRSVLAVGRYDPAPPVVRRRVGSLTSDAEARSRDMEEFGGDVQRGRPVAASG